VLMTTNEFLWRMLMGLVEHEEFYLLQPGPPMTSPDSHLCRYTASVTSSGSRLRPRIKAAKPGRAAPPCGPIGDDPSSGWQGDATQLLERAGVVIGQRCSGMAARRSRPMPFEPAVKTNRLTACNRTGIFFAHLVGVIPSNK
jgi:hypothetical protein